MRGFILFALLASASALEMKGNHAPPEWRAGNAAPGLHSPQSASKTARTVLSVLSSRTHRPTRWTPQALRTFTCVVFGKGKEPVDSSSRCSPPHLAPQFSVLACSERRRRRAGAWAEGRTRATAKCCSQSAAQILGCKPAGDGEPWSPASAIFEKTSPSTTKCTCFQCTPPSHFSSLRLEMNSFVWIRWGQRSANHVQLPTAESAGLTITVHSTVPTACCGDAL